MISIEHIFRIEVSSSNGLSVIRHTTYTFHVEIAHTICILRAQSECFYVQDVNIFHVPHVHDVFVGPGFQPLTLQHGQFVGPEFDSQAQPSVSGPPNSWPMSMAKSSISVTLYFCSRRDFSTEKCYRHSVV